MKAVGLGAVLSVVLNLALIPKFGLMGAGMTRLACSAIISVYFGFQFRRISHLKWARHLLKPALASALMIAVMILVGHSWAGTVITQAGVHPKVVSLVYVAAFQPDKGETTNQWAATQPKDSKMRVSAPDKKGVIFFDRTTFHAGFCADLSQETADFMNASQQPIVGQCFATPVTEAAWKNKPSYGIVATDDKTINPIIERNMYKRAKDKVTEIKGSHVIFISHPDLVAQVIINAAQSK